MAETIPNESAERRPRRRRDSRVDDLASVRTSGHAPASAPFRFSSHRLDLLKGRIGKPSERNSGNEEKEEKDYVRERYKRCG